MALEKASYREASDLIQDWIQSYFERLPQLPVRSQVSPGEVYSAIPEFMPKQSEPIEQIIADLDRVILPGITHWQHPNFHAYFPANSSVESVLAEQITAAIGAQCMIWETSPAAAELEQRMLEWLRDAMGLPNEWEGVIQDTASTATLAAILTAREICTNWRSNWEGVPPNLRIYCSEQAHSSVDKAVAIAGIGRDNLVKIAVKDDLSIDSRALTEAIVRDRNEGLIPCCVILTLGTTGTVAIDSVEEAGKVCRELDVWCHVDAAYAGTALLLPEYQYWMRGAEFVDSFVFNPHKWMFTNFDCSAYFVRDREALIRTFEILPEYLRTATRGKVNDYRDWGIPLGRRFRALKLWMVIRSFGLKGIQERLRHHIKLNQFFSNAVRSSSDFELLFPHQLNFTSFRFRPATLESDEEMINHWNMQLIKKVNESGRAYLTHTMVNGQYVIRMVIGQTYVEREDIESVWALLQEKGREMLKELM